MSTEDLKRAQDRGWVIKSASDTAMTVQCPSHGCNLMAKIQYGGHVPQVDPCLSRAPDEQPIGSYEDLRLILRARRRELGLTITEIEEVAGLTKDHIAKAEKNDPTRIPGMDTISFWATALGYEIVLRRGPLPKVTLRTITETRRYQESRRQVARRQERLALPHRR